jgi:hypothetical protein
VWRDVASQWLQLRCGRGGDWCTVTKPSCNTHLPGLLSRPDPLRILLRMARCRNTDSTRHPFQGERWPLTWNIGPTYSHTGTERSSTPVVNGLCGCLNCRWRARADLQLTLPTVRYIEVKSCLCLVTAPPTRMGAWRYSSAYT